MLYFCLTVTVKGQVESVEGDFLLNQIRGCAPLVVDVTNNSNIPDESVVYVFNWHGSLTERINVDENQALNPDTTYSVPGIYRILQIKGGRAGIPTTFDSVTIEVMEPLTPQFKVYNCINNAVYVDFSEEDYYDELTINFGDDENSITLSTSDNDHYVYPYTEPGNYIISVEGLFDGALQSCSPIDTLVTTFSGDEFARVDIDVVRVENRQSIEVGYDELQPNIPYQLEVSENGSGNFEVVADLPAASTAFSLDDPDFDTRENFYCFRVVAVNLCDPEESIPISSNIVCSIALQATPEDLQNRLEWQSEGFSNYEVNRNASLLSAVSTNEYIDTNVECQEEYMYTVVAQANGATSISLMETITAISTELSPAPLNLEANLQSASAALNWPAVGDASMYYIYRSEDGGASQLYDSLQASPTSNFTYTDPQTLAIDVSYCYQLSYRDACANESELSEEVCVLLPSQANVFFPNAFTPNGDGLNEIFVYKANLLASVRFQIYNRWGELLFSTEEIGRGWDGTYRGQMAPQGTYLYVLDVVDELGNAFSKNGKFTLLPAGL